MHDKTRDVAVDVMLETAFESYSRRPLGGCSSGFSSSIDASANRSGRSSMNSDAIVVMSMLATDALIQVRTASLSHILYQIPVLMLNRNAVLLPLKALPSSMTSSPLTTIT